MTQLFSFDIFDTLLTRLVIEPTDIFEICGDRAWRYGWINCSAATYREMRINAEKRSRLFCEGGEANLDEIYREVGNTLEVEKDVIDKLQQLELEVEIEYLVAVPRAYPMIEKARKSSDLARVVFLSDMYLPETFLIERLKQHGFWKDGDRLYVSCQYRKSKGQGDLFLQVLADFKLHPQGLVHTGNNELADVAKPKSLGISAIYFDEANPNRYEQINQKYGCTTAGISSFWAGVSRYTRLSPPSQTLQKLMIGNIAACVAAPILSAYVTWVLQQAKVRQLVRIYFLARDGEILLQIAKELAPKIYPEVELRYIYVSRQALRMPGLTKISQAFWEWMFDDTDIFTVESLLARMCFEFSDAQPIFEPLGYPRDRWQQNLSAKERKELRSKLENHGLLQEKILEVAARKREVLKAYLTQEKMLDGQAFGLVDVGWKGSLQLSLESAFERFGTRNPVGFYFALEKPSGGLKHQGEVLAFFFNLNNSTGLRNQIDYRYVSAMEVFCAGCEGTTLDYATQSDGSVKPVLKHIHNQPALDWGLKYFQTTVIAFVNQLVTNSSQDFNLNYSPKLLREALDQLFLAFTSSPTLQESQAFTDCPFFDDPNELYHFYWAMPFRVRDILSYSVSLREGFSVHRNSWDEASLQVSSPMVKVLLPIAIAQRKFLKKIKKILMQKHRKGNS
ncbi:MAG: hypothetical protein AUK48_14960 [Oscillatoriales cyanobacterium CG2_30_44_21]|nr:MAG: hypothetical protein AUK48_14960 [Oscillatoriales cyanobacterium CG2_30_44_21]